MVDCEAGVRTPNADLCSWCIPRFQASGLTVEQFAAIPANKISRVEQFCRVLGCPRPSSMRIRFCHVHYIQWRRTGLAPEQFAASPTAVPLASFGQCLVVSCSRAACGTGGLCNRHRDRWQGLQKREPAADFQRWLRIAEPVNVDHLVIFKGLAGQAQLELLLGLQVRTDAGVRTLVTALRPIVAALRAAEAPRQWVNSIAHLLVTTVTGADGKQHEQVFDRLAVIPYAYRHSYAQRHADEGVPPDVLRDLLGHDKIGTTLGYYR